MLKVPQTYLAGNRTTVGTFSQSSVQNGGWSSWTYSGMVTFGNSSRSSTTTAPAWISDMTRRSRTITAKTTCSMPSRSPAKAPLGGWTLDDGPAHSLQTSSTCDSKIVPSCCSSATMSCMSGGRHRSGSATTTPAPGQANGIPELASACFSWMLFKRPESTATQGAVSVQGSASRKDILSSNTGGAARSSYSNDSTAPSAGAAENLTGNTTGDADGALGLVKVQLSAGGGAGDNNLKAAANADEIAPGTALAMSLDIASDGRSTSSDTDDDASPTTSDSEGAHSQVRSNPARALKLLKAHTA
ncbi:hypothetical protein AURDEDRAFT_172113 [Auricularia subglabra TFB-10046 SS5]|nr:hypothetical protein AURDEDRAFT_172113 [Auricularia subglabra TFB-10046 SS5]